MIGPGKYDDVCSMAREMAEANGAIVIIVRGSKGNGFSAQLSLEDTLAIPHILRAIADQIENSAHQC